MQRNISLTTNHDMKLLTLAKKLGLSRSEVIRRAIDSLEEREAQRDKEVAQ
jgi:Arc/MetJ-type ribon-helix-helix transcriptional regulator